MFKQATVFRGSTADETDILVPLIQSIDRFGRDRIDAKKIDSEHRIPRDVLRDLAALGMFGLSIPEEFGGAGLSLAGVCTGVAALARWDRSVATTVGLHLGLGTRPLVAFGTPALRAAYLPALARGDKIAAFATTESGAGSDLSAIRTTAVARGAHGSELVIDGEKIYVTNGGLASVITITASTPELGGARKGHSLVLLEREDRGLEVGPEETKLGLKGSSTVTLHFDGVRVPYARLIGEPGKGMSHLEHVLAWGRTAMAAGCTGAARAAIMRTIDHVTTRVQFGKAIGEFEVVKAQVARMASTCFAMEALVSSVCEAEDDPALLLRRSLSAKVFASEGDWAISDMAVQLHGGAGFIEDTELPMFLRDARITRIFEGANDVLLTHAGSLEIIGQDTRSSQDIRSSSADDRIDLGRDANAVHGLVREKVDALKREQGLRLLRNQRELHRVGRMSVLRDACDAVVRRAATDGSDSACMLARSFVDEAMREVQVSMAPLTDAEAVKSITATLYSEVVG